MTAAAIRVGAVVLAAGQASRFGELKQVVPIGGEPMVRRVTCNVLAAGFDPVIVVVGAQFERVIACLHPLTVKPLVNPQWERGLGPSLAAGVKALMDATDTPGAVLVMLADQPLVTSGDLGRLRSAYATSPGVPIASQHEELLGPPCIFPLTLADELMTLDGAPGARTLLERHVDQVIGFPLPTAFQDMDTRDDYAAVLAATEWPFTTSSP